jgi:hypothetical protein
MEPIYLICYGNSEENVKKSFDKGIIGASNFKRIPIGQLIYLIVKRDGEWVVVGRGHISDATTDNPFEKPNRFSTYKVNDLIKCAPFSISSICKSELGDRYGLVLRSPQPITAEKFVKYLEDNCK